MLNNFVLKNPISTMLPNHLVETAAQKDPDLLEYLLAAFPDHVINEKIEAEKKLFFKKNEHTTTHETRPYIAIARFFIKPMMEETLTRWMQNIFRLHQSFHVTLNNFSGFPPHKIYLRVQDPKPFNQIANALKILDGFIESNNCSPVLVEAKPHLSIAEKLSEAMYEESIKCFAQSIFHESFAVEKLALVKTDASMNHKLVHTFILAQPF